jgi:hypothetical protein
MSKFLPQNGATLKSQGDQDLDVFIDKLTRKLLPIYKDYPQHIKDVSYGNREKIKAAFLKVTDGKMTFKKWFEYIHTNLGKHPVDLANMLVACTEGLNSAEIKEFRQGAQQFQQYVAQFRFKLPKFWKTAKQHSFVILSSSYFFSSYKSL